MRDEKQSDEELARQLPDDLSQFAEHLGTFRARVSQIDRDRMLFEAGRASVQSNSFPSADTSTRRLRRWKCATLLTSATSILLSVLLLSVVVGRKVATSPDVKTTTEASRQNRSENELTPVDQVPDSHSHEKPFDPSPVSTGPELAAAKNEPGVRIGRLQAMQVALVRSIDSKVDEAQIWPQHGATPINGSPRTYRPKPPLRPFSLLKDENSKRMFDVLTEESRL